MRALLLASLPLLGVLWSIGFLRRQSLRSARSMGNTAAGMAVGFAAVVWLFKNRKDAVSVVAVTALVLICRYLIREF